MLRPYQIEAVKITRSTFKWSKRTILTLPTGSGKTRCGSAIALMSVERGKKVDILVHRIETLTQFVDTLRVLGHDPVVCTSDNKNVDWDAPIIVGMVETYHKRTGSHERKTDLIIVDEAHRGEFRKVVKGYDGYVLGLSATPLASSKDKPLNEYFEACVNPIKSSWLIEQGFLCEPEYFVPKFDGKRLKMEKGEFTEASQLAEFMAPKLYRGALDQYLKIAGGEKAICYNVNVEHSLKMFDEFTMAGIKCWHVDGKTPKDKREKIFREFSEYSGACVLHNVGVATTGTDIPSVTTIILNRATTQFALYHQMVGRGSRPYEGKSKFKIIDMGGNSTRFKSLGVYGQDVDWQYLFSNPEGQYDGRKPRDMKKSCPRCAKSIPIRKTTCPCCEYRFTKEEALKMAELTRDLVLMREVAKEYMPERLKGKKSMDMSYRELCEYAQYMGYEHGWVGRQMGLKKAYKKQQQFKSQYGFK